MLCDSKHVRFFLFLIFCFSQTCCTIIMCPQTEKHALLKFEQSLEDPSHMLSSWNVESEGNCCAWKRVVCSNITGHVRHLHLRGQLYEFGLSGELNPSILLLKELKYLDLSQNDFGVRIPSFLGLLTSLEYLDLSNAGFYGRIPHNIGNLSNLHTLNLDGNWMCKIAGESDQEVSLDVDSIDWLSGMSRMEYLNMNGVNLSKAANWNEVINRLPSLVNLKLSDCSLNSMSPLKHVNISSLTLLDLSSNNFSSITMPRWVFQQPNLISLDLSYNYFGGPFPAIINTTKLKFIDLSFNVMNSSIPDWLYFCKDLEYVSMSWSNLHGKISNAIGNLTSLRTLDLSKNELSGNIPTGIASLCKMQNLDLSENKLIGDVSYSFGNISVCFLEVVTFLIMSYNQLSGHLTPQFGEFKSLLTLDLGMNSISGTIPINIGKLSSLYTLDLSYNKLTGKIPINIGKLSSLNTLDLSYNKLTGNLPESLGQLLNLEYLNIEHNMLEGIVTETHFSNLTNLFDLIASDNHLLLKVSSAWVPPFTLDALHLRSWNFGGDSIPSWIQTHESITELDLSNTGISGHVPTRFWEIPILNLSNNNLYGQIPHIRGPATEFGFSMVSLSCNKFSGSLPRVADSVIELDLSNNSFTAGMSQFLCDTTNQTYAMEILHLWGNQLTGELPDCFMKWPSLVYLNLANNNFSGNIPNSIGFLTYLQSLNLHGNKFSGQIPFPMHNCARLLKLDLGGNDLAGNIPTWIGTSFAELMFLILRSNKLSGEIPSHVCRLNALQILDLSDNAFFGVIPKCVDNFTAMATQRSLDTYLRKEFDYNTSWVLYNESASVATKGSIYEYNTILSLVTNIDLSNNNLSGDIPEELTRLVELRSLNLSGNDLAGRIPDSMGDMKQLESLDLSRNSLFGEIPNNFTLMSSLNYLDLSFNNLTGRIPTSTQLQLMKASSFVGNHLCGPPLSNNCGDGDPSVNDDPSENDEAKIEWVYVFLSLGYAMGLSACCTALALKKSWRDAWFGLMECIWDKLYVHFCVKWRSLTMKASPLS